MSKISEDLELIIEDIQALKTKSDFSQAMFSMTNILSKAQKEDLDDILHKNNHISPLYHVFKNKYFNDAAFSLLEQKQGELQEEKTLVHSGLRLSTFVLAYVFPSISDNSIRYLNNVLNKRLGSVRYIQSNSGLICTKFHICSLFSEIIFNFNNEYQERYSGFVDFDSYRKTFITSRSLIASMLHILQQEAILKKKFADFTYNKKRLGAKFNLALALNSINTESGIINSLCNNVPAYNRDNFDHFISVFDIDNNIKTANHIIKLATNGFEYQSDRSGTDAVAQIIANIKNTKRDLNTFARSNLRAYSGSLSGVESEWSNKIYLITVKTLSALEALDGARDIKWIINVFNHEFHRWADEVHKVINKYDIEDDWEKIRELIVQEDSSVEWKSTFYTPTERLFLNDTTEKILGKDILRNVTRAMLGMMNSDGGYVLVGLVENPQSIVRKDVKKNTIIKNNLTFFDIHYEFDKKNKNTDILKREIQDILYAETLYTAEKFNNLWDIEPIKIKSGDSSAMIYKISVVKSERNIYNVKKEGGSVWISLTKRADGRTIFVDPRDSLL